MGFSNNDGRTILCINQKNAATASETFMWKRVFQVPEQRKRGTWKQQKDIPAEEYFREGAVINKRIANDNQ